MTNPSSPSCGSDSLTLDALLLRQNNSGGGAFRSVPHHLFPSAIPSLYFSDTNQLSSFLGNPQGQRRLVSDILREAIEIVEDTAALMDEQEERMAASRRNHMSHRPGAGDSNHGGSNQSQ
jgi:hypothetical protein